MCVRSVCFVFVLLLLLHSSPDKQHKNYTSHVPAALELLCDCVINPAFKPEEVEEQKMRLEMLLASPDVQLTILTEVRVECVVLLSFGVVATFVLLSCPHELQCDSVRTGDRCCWSNMSLVQLTIPILSVCKCVVCFIV